MSDPFEEVRMIIVDMMGVEKDTITPNSRFREDLGADSLDLIEIIIVFEDLLGMQISDQDMRKIQSTVGEAVQFLKTHRAE